MVWISWSKLTLSKRDGGLGFREIQKFNDALLAKISWRILSKPSCLLAKTLMGKYCKNSTFLECHVTSSTSHGWRGICIGRDLLKANIGKAIGNGADTNVWSEPLALLLALQHAKDLGITTLSIASDSQQLIKAINSRTPSPELHGILHDTLRLASEFGDVKFSSIPRCENRAADKLSKAGLASIFNCNVPGLTFSH